MKFLIDWIRGYFFLAKIKKSKRELLSESQFDKMFFEKYFKDKLDYNESADRQILIEENKKSPDKVDRLKVSAAEARIGYAKAIKQSYSKTDTFINEITLYNEMLNKTHIVNEYGKATYKVSD